MIYSERVKFSSMNHQRIYSFAPILLLVWILSSCGGAGGSVSSTRNLPPDPGSAATATVIGVDTNNNGVRDEVEINISKNVENENDYAATLAVAAAYQKYLIQPLPTTRSEALKFPSYVACAESGAGTPYGGDNGAFIMEQTFNTPERKAIEKSIGALIGPSFRGSELSACQ